MVKGENYIKKQSNTSEDYKKAYDVSELLKRGSTTIIEVDNIKRFRRYLYHLGYCRNKSYATRKIADFQINITRIS